MSSMEAAASLVIPAMSSRRATSPDGMQALNASEHAKRKREKSGRVREGGSGARAIRVYALDLLRNDCLVEVG
jgi:hypothetical protein